MQTIILISLFLVCACTSNKHVVKEIDNQIETHGEIGGAQVGLNAQREIVIQNESDIVSELKGQEFNNYEQETKIQYIHEKLTQCRKDIADPRLSGSGVVQPIPEVDGLKATNEIKESIGKNKQERLVVVKREYYLDRLKLERQYGTVLTEVFKKTNKLNDTCQHELSVARVRAGLPANKIPGKGHFDTQGNWIVDRPSEKNLDDAFEMRKPASSEE